jgi:hypothetical protein
LDAYYIAMLQELMQDNSDLREQLVLLQAAVADLQGSRCMCG